jgi:hypothetical protein
VKVGNRLPQAGDIDTRKAKLSSLVLLVTCRTAVGLMRGGRGGDDTDDRRLQDVGDAAVAVAC